MYPWGFAISTQAGPRTPDEGRKKGQLCRRAFPEGKGSPTESLFPKNLSSLVDYSNPGWRTPNSSLFSSACTRRAEAMWLGMSVLTAIFQAP